MVYCHGRLVRVFEYRNPDRSQPYTVVKPRGTFTRYRRVSTYACACGKKLPWYVPC